MHTQTSGTPDELSTRLDFIGLNDEATRAVAAIQPLIEKHLPDALDKFYAKLVTVPAVAKFFSGTEQMGRAKGSQHGHWTAIAKGQLDAAYLESATKIGMRHAKIGLEPRWYIGGYALIVETMLKGVIADYIAQHQQTKPQGLFGRQGQPGLDSKSVAELSEGLAALIKAVMVDVDIAVTTYFDKLTAEAAEAQRQSAAKIEHAVTETGKALNALASGDLTSRISAQFDPALQQLKDDTNAVADRLTAVITQLRATSRSLRTATGELLEGANDLADRTTRQAANVEETSASMEQISSTVNENAKLAGDANLRIQNVEKIAAEGGAVMANATTAMERITESSSKISGIIGMIDDIAFQTNLLALNASVEAARAGEAGKGFSVVAVEVRRLAQSAAEASRDIKTLIEASSQEVKLGSGLVTDAASKLAAIVDGVRQCTVLTTQIAESSNHQSASIHEVNVAIRQMDEMTQHNAALVEETNAAIEQTEGQAGELDRIVDAFRLDTGLETAGLQRRPKRRVA